MRRPSTILNPRRIWLRIPLKVAIFAVVLLAVLYPNPRLLVRNLDHWQRLDALADPTSPALDPLADELAERIADGTDGPDALNAVQTFVNNRIPYGYDWEVWGVVDYVPTVEEVIAAGREDCDGRAVLAAALLKRMGYDAHLRCDGSHVWVWTPSGQTMAPVQTSSGRTLVATTGDTTRIDWGALFAMGGLFIDLPTNISFGIAVFPLGRELILLLTAWILLRRPDGSLRRQVVGLALAVGGLMILRTTCANPWERALGGSWAGLLTSVVGLVLPVLPRPRLRPIARGRTGEETASSPAVSPYPS